MGGGNSFLIPSSPLRKQESRIAFSRVLAGPTRNLAIPTRERGPAHSLPATRTKPTLKWALFFRVAGVGIAPTTLRL